MTGESAGEGEEAGWKDKPSDVGPVGMCNGDAAKPLLVYQRRAKRPWIESGSEQSGEGDDKGRLDAAAESLGDVRIVKARTCMKYELLRLGSGSGSLSSMSRLRLRSNEGRKRVNFSEARKNVHGPQKDSSGWSKVKKWVELEIEGVDPHALIGLECKANGDWYKGSITEYNSDTKQHRVWHAMWPTVVVSESNFGPKNALKPSRTNESILVQFFGTHDFARIKLKQAIPFLNGLLSSLHLKCKQARFCRSLDEAKIAETALFGYCFKSMKIIYVEACESGSIFEGLMPEDLNVYVTTASNAVESSWGTYCPGMDPPPPPKYMTCLVDLYSVAWMEDRFEFYT
ncbi:hypothetical protein ZIOFF_038465 [Zingiber officinale]|uniref:PWWP domain-containing protein n=1 Tax=Zingiber officinale TaxID=94328 RepID=A0A8J5KSM1_ZINOF|nr:hypothetical protein ZIOFF_038465 [Zingiber officinale]